MCLRGGRHSLRSHVDNHNLHAHGLRSFFRHGRQICVDLGTFCADSAPEAHAYMWLPVHMVAPTSLPSGVPILIESLPTRCQGWPV